MTSSRPETALAGTADMASWQGNEAPGTNVVFGRNTLLPGPRSHLTRNTPPRSHRYQARHQASAVSASENDHSPAGLTQVTASPTFDDEPDWGTHPLAP